MFGEKKKCGIRSDHKENFTFIVSFVCLIKIDAREKKSDQLRTGVSKKNKQQRHQTKLVSFYWTASDFSRIFFGRRRRRTFVFLVHCFDVFVVLFCVLCTSMGNLGNIDNECVCVCVPMVQWSISSSLFHPTFHWMICWMKFCCFLLYLCVDDHHSQPKKKPTEKKTQRNYAYQFIVCVCCVCAFVYISFR